MAARVRLAPELQVDQDQQEVQETWMATRLVQVAPAALQVVDVRVAREEREAPQRAGGFRIVKIQGKAVASAR